MATPDSMKNAQLVALAADGERCCFDGSVIVSVLHAARLARPG